MADPKSTDERLASIENGLAHLDKLVSAQRKSRWKGAVLVGSLWIGLFLIYGELVTLEQNLNAVENSARAVNNAAASLNASARALNQAAANFPGVVADALKNDSANPGIGAQPPGTLNIVVFIPSQGLLIRDALPKSAKSVVADADKLALGQPVQDQQLFAAFEEIPDPVLKEVPQLAATRFLVGTSRIAFARIADRRIVGFVER